MAAPTTNPNAFLTHSLLPLWPDQNLNMGHANKVAAVVWCCTKRYNRDLDAWRIEKRTGTKVSFVCMLPAPYQPAFRFLLFKIRAFAEATRADWTQIIRKAGEQARFLRRDKDALIRNLVFLANVRDAAVLEILETLYVGAKLPGPVPNGTRLLTLDRWLAQEWDGGDHDPESLEGKTLTRGDPLRRDWNGWSLQGDSGLRTALYGPLADAPDPTPLTDGSGEVPAAYRNMCSNWLSERLTNPQLQEADDSEADSDSKSKAGAEVAACRIPTDGRGTDAAPEATDRTQDDNHDDAADGEGSDDGGAHLASGGRVQVFEDSEAFSSAGPGEIDEGGNGVLEVNGEADHDRRTAPGAAGSPYDTAANDSDHPKRSRDTTPTQEPITDLARKGNLAPDRDPQAVGEAEKGAPGIGVAPDGSRLGEDPHVAPAQGGHPTNVPLPDHHDEHTPALSGAPAPPVSTGDAEASGSSPGVISASSLPKRARDPEATEDSPLKRPRVEGMLTDKVLRATPDPGHPTAALALPQVPPLTNYGLKEVRGQSSSRPHSAEPTAPGAPPTSQKVTHAWVKECMARKPGEATL
ncbi:hypothetical protein BOTBODRAFT_182180 [Botryobasidium botryosum FD-172 SS1]|uniref:Uncharacterized protein n=1 Tax=Botryobasidium botryosum (strain FD-172 SS1) TaxID=930990 RepID=A0A067LRL3_BOTB1|nr:hypothetical protein BOTBODRAFT_182180 [Botryobasidium botryosum FD-172 SS1]